MVNYMEILFPTILVQAVVTVFLIWTNRKQKSEDYFLTLIMCTFLMHIAFKYFLWLISHDGDTYRKMHGSFSLLYGPFLFCYTKIVKGEHVDSFFKKIIYLPFVVALLLNIMLALQIAVAHDYMLLDVYESVIVPFALASNSFYVWLVLRKIFIVKDPTPIMRHKLSIARTIAIVLSVPSVLFVINVFLQDNPVDIRTVWYGTILIMFVIVLNHRFKISLLPIMVNRSQEETAVAAKPYAHSSLEHHEKETILNRLEDAMRKNRLYRDPDLSLDGLASSLNVSRHHLTEVLNHAIGMNFYQYVNMYRVEEAKGEIVSKNDCNLISIAFDCGFKSKSTFNKYFKEITGVSPSEYREKSLSQLQTVG
jgi:AraC-like DNA-binding protein